MTKNCLLCFLVVLLTAFQRRPTIWVAVGDSITYLNNHQDETKNRVHNGYLTDVTAKLPFLEYRNQGRNGWTVQGFAEHIDSLHIPVGDIYTVFLGTNDWWHGTPVGTWDDYRRGTGYGTIYGSFRILIDKLHRLNAAAPIVLITPMPRTDFVYINDPTNNAWGSYKPRNGITLEEIAGAILAIGRQEQLTVVDLYHDPKLAVSRLVRYKRLKDPHTGAYRNYPYPDYTAVPFHPGIDEYPYPAGAEEMTFDGLHPSDEGNLEIAARLIPDLKRLSK